MEADRFGMNRKYFIIGIICLCLGIFLFVFSFYTFPFLVFKWHYKVPEYFLMFHSYLQLTYNLESKAAGWLIFLGLFFPSIVLFIVADILSNKIDGEIYRDYVEDETLSKSKKRSRVGESESKGLVLRITVIIILVFIASEFFQWAISTTPPI